MARVRRLRSSAEVRAVGASGISAGATFLAALIVARALDPSDRGSLAVIQVTAVLLAAPAALGMGPAIVYFLSRGDRSPSTVVRTALVVATGSSVVVVGISAGALTLLNRPGIASVQLLGVIPFAVAGVLVDVWRADGAYRLWNIGRTLGPVSWLLAAAVVSGLGRASVTTLVVGQVLAYSVVGVVVVGLLRGRLRRGTERLPRVEPTRMIWYGVPTAGAHFLNHASRRLDQLLIASIVPSAALGQYTVAATWASLLLVVGNALGQPSMAQIARLELVEAHEAARHLVRRMAVPILLATVASVATAPILVPALFGGDYRDAVVPSMLLSAGTGLAAIGSVGAEMMRAVGRPKVPLLGEGAGVACAVVAVPVLASHWGIEGTAIGSIVAYGVTVAIVLRALRGTPTATSTMA